MYWVEQNIASIPSKEFRNQEALNRYTKNKFTQSILSTNHFPLADESFIEIWSEFEKASQKNGVFKTLRDHLIPLQFPIEKGISTSEAYRKTTLRGRAAPESVKKGGLPLEEPEHIQLYVYQSFAGKIPVIVIPNRVDFNTLLRAIFHKNEPIELPDSMGASFINGIINWTRIHRLKENWLRNHPKGNWPYEFKNHIAPNRSLYQDKIILLSTKDYSNIPASSLGISSKQWKEDSLHIRLEHECTHYFTLRYFGKMANNMHDELLADYMGIIKVLGHFKSDWFLHFIGLENYPNYRDGGRLENYLGTPPLPKKAFDQLKTLMKNASDQVELFDVSLGKAKSDEDRVIRLLSLASLSLNEIAQGNGAKKLRFRYEYYVGRENTNEE